MIGLRLEGEEITMIKKDFDEDYVFELVEKMLKYSEAIIDYLSKNKENLSKLILRYASEKLPKEKRAEIFNWTYLWKRRSSETFCQKYRFVWVSVSISL